MALPTDPPSTPAVTLDNCDREPIHIPGQIQPDGALLAFDQAGTLVAWSANVPAVLGFDPAPGATLSDLPLVEDATRLLREAIEEMARGDVPPAATDIRLGELEFDLIIHAYQKRAIAEFARRDQSIDEVATFALKAHRAIERLKRQRTTEELLTTAVADVRMLTGFDRVMAYRFRHDDSGDVVAESCLPTLERYVGRRYPAGDIPAQARRLYVLNTLRLISDVGYQPVALVGWTNEPLDMSHCVLRSVSPIHIEYLQNMGVGASMSVSIVIDGRLWGLIACHHMSARRVPFSIRMACDVLAQVLAANIHASVARSRAAAAESAASVRARLAESMLQEEDVLRSIEKHGELLSESLAAHAIIATQFGKVFTLGDIDRALAVEIVRSLPDDGLALVHRTDLEHWPQSIRSRLGSWVGLLGIRFDPSTQGAVLALRREQIETVRWGGKPEKNVQVGPLGPRLTPRGSFEEWREVVRGKAEPWDETRLLIARQLLAEMQRVSNARHAETERARMQLLAMLGHDLRDPLQSITMAAAVLQKGASSENLTRRIQASSNRMQRLIGLVLDMSRIESGLGLGLVMNPTDLSRVVANLIDEAKTAHPGMTYVLDTPETLNVVVDRDRIEQVVSNLVSNARHHGHAGHPIRVEVRDEPDRTLIRVLNVGDPISPALAATLFNAFKDQNRRNERNPTGMGLGLHIARQIVIGHGGTILYSYAEPHVVFTVELPKPKAPTG